MDAFSTAELRLLVQTEDEVEAEEPVFKLDGRTWWLRTFTNPTSVPGYICVSYVWGTGRVPNPFLSAPASISANTVPALSAAMAGTECRAFWIDAFCIPTTQPARRATLESMGYIYSQAVESVWTYQEVVNSRDLAFVCANAVGVVVDGTDFLNGLGFTLYKYKQTHGLDTFTIRERFPSLDALDDVLGDWRVASRCALLVMSNMDRRKWAEERNYFYAMIGSVTRKPSHRTGQGMEDQHLSETFMSVCEEMNDFSFIYTFAPRSTNPSRRWRPGAGLLPSLLPWQSWGEAQPGHFDQDGKFWLDEVLHFELSMSSLTEAARDFIAFWLHREDLVEKTEEEFAQAVHSTLLRMGFTGSQDYIILGDGLFFPQTSSIRDGFDLVVSTTIRWPLGAPGLVRVRSPRIKYIPGVFAGPMGLTGPVTKRSGTSFCLE